MKTTPKYEVVRATLEHALELARVMKEEDAAEVMALNNHTPEEAAVTAWRVSTEAWTWLVDGEVMCMFGIAQLNMVYASPWMLASKNLPRHARHFAVRSKIVVQAWREKYPRLVQLVDARYVTAVRWLEWLGFTIHPAEIVNGYHRAHRVELGD